MKRVGVALALFTLPLLLLTLPLHWQCDCFWVCIFEFSIEIFSDNFHSE
jgi:hypothetical protein